jgi:cytochrome c biogenesis protein CcmG/thiol:disulfide interchange protein DsbE
VRAAASVLLGLLVGACSATPAPPEKEAPPEPTQFAVCTGIDAGAAKLPEVSVPCFTGGQPVKVDRLRGPLVVNFFASWCAPCREELPAFQRLADSGRVPVVGVVTDDRRSAALSLAVDLGVRFPALFDAGGEFRRARGEAALPLTLFIDEHGAVTSYSGPALTDETLGRLVTQRLVSAS